MMGLDAVTRSIDAYIQIVEEQVHIQVDPTAVRVSLAFIITLIFAHKLIEALFERGAKEAAEKISEGAKTGIYGMFFFTTLILTPILTYLDVLLGAASFLILTVALPYYYGARIRERILKVEKQKPKITHAAMEIPPAATQQTAKTPQVSTVKETEGENEQKRVPKKVKMPDIHVASIISAIAGKLGSAGKMISAKKPEPKAAKSAEKSIPKPEKAISPAPQKMEKLAENQEKEQKTPAVDVKALEPTHKKKVAEQKTFKRITEKKEEKEETNAQNKAENRPKKGGLLSMLKIFGGGKGRTRPQPKREKPRIKIEEVTPETVVTVKESTLKERRVGILPRGTSRVQEIKPTKQEEEKESTGEVEKKVEETREEPTETTQERQEEVPEDVKIFREVIDAMERKYIKKEAIEEKRGPRRAHKGEGPASTKKKRSARTEAKPAEQQYNKTTYNRIRDALKNILFEQEKAKRGRITWREVREIRKSVESEILPKYHEKIIEEAVKLGDRPTKTDIENAARRILGMAERKAEDKKKREHHRRRGEKTERTTNEEESEDNLDISGLLGGETEGGEDEGDLGALLGGDEGDLDLDLGEDEDLENLL